MVGKKSWKRVVMVGVGVFLLGALLVGCQKALTAPGSDLIQIGITQIVEHPALDRARQGFIDGLAEGGYEEGKKIAIDFQSAQGDINIARIIADKFTAQKKDLILAIATPSAQMAYQATKEIPILITAVTNPMEAGLVKSFEKTGTNVTGTSDSTPPSEHLQLLLELVPNAQKIGILFNAGEANSAFQVSRIQEVAPQFKLEVVTAAVTNTNDVNQSLDFLLGQVDALYTIQDNVVASSMPLIAKKATDKRIPIIGAERAHVDGGALATDGIDYYKLGVKTAQMAIKVLEGQQPQEMGIELLTDLELFINMDVVENLNIAIPKNLEERAKLIRNGVVQND